MRDGIPFKGDLASTAQVLLDRQKTQRPVTVREALSDLPKAVSEDDGALAYPKKRGGRTGLGSAIIPLSFIS